MVKVTLVALGLAILISAAHCRFVEKATDEYFYYQLENGTIIFEDLTKPVDMLKKLKQDDNDLGVVTLYLYTSKTGPDNPCSVKADSCTNWLDCGFDPNKRTVLLTHGYHDTYLVEGVQLIKNAYLATQSDVNIVIIDWSPANSPYLYSVSYVKTIGETTAGVINYLQTDCEADPAKVECIGHSLGAHICGVFSATLPQKTSRIVGLDPAAPVIGSFGVDGRLDITDTDNLQIIHTSSYGLSITHAIGHIDFYPNGAEKQYGCDGPDLGQAVIGSCDHRKSKNLYADSILYSNLFQTNLECDSDDAALDKSCKAGNVVTTLGEANNRSDSGIFYIDTTPIYAIISPKWWWG